MTTSTRPLLLAGVGAGVVAAVCTTVVALVARSAGVALEVDGTAVPVLAFAWWTLVGTLVGVVLARLLRERRRFVAVALVGTALSLVPALTLPDDVATRLVLGATHVVAASVVVPVLARRLRTANAGS